MPDKTYAVSNSMMRGALRLFADWSVTGRGNVPMSGPLLVASNHLSNLDPPLLGASLPRRLNFIAKRGLFKPLVGAFLRAYGAYALNPEEQGKDVEALLWMRKLLREDRAVVVFPESHRNPEEGLQEGVPGVALMAVKTQTPILPVGIAGSESVGPIWRVAVPTGSISVTIGEPFTLPDVKGRLEPEQLKELMDGVMRRIAACLPERYHGVYGRDAQPGPGASP